MLGRLLLKIFLRTALLLMLCGVTQSWGLDTSSKEIPIYNDKAKIVYQQIDLLKTRLAQSQNELQTLQKAQDQFLNKLTVDRVSKLMLSQTALDIAAAKSNLNGVNIELSESQQAVSRLEKETQEIKNQLNIFDIFGVKIARINSTDLNRLNQELSYQNAMLQLEKTRVAYLLKLQTIADGVLQIYTAKYAFIDSLLKSQTVVHLKEQQTRSEVDFQQQQMIWLRRLSQLNTQVEKAQLNNKLDRSAIEKLQDEIFYVNENLNYTYLEILIARYEDQIQQLKISISHSSSITVLNKASEQVQTLGKQITRVGDLLASRVDILSKRSDFVVKPTNMTEYQLVPLSDLVQHYKKSIVRVAQLNKDLSAFRVSLEQLLQQELSSRQGLPAFGSKVWLDLGAEIFLIPSLAFQAVKSLSVETLKGFYYLNSFGWLIFAMLQIGWIFLIGVLHYFLKKLVSGMQDHEYGHINIKWLIVKLADRILLDILILGNIFGLFFFLKVPNQNYSFLINLAWVWLFFKSIIVITRLCLVETVQESAGHDVRLYHQLKRLFLFGAIVTGFTVFIHQLPVIYEVKDLFDRLFLVFLLFTSLFLLKQWQLLPGLILPHIDERRTYLKGIVKLVGLLIPVLLLFNSIVGLFGFVNLILTISWYESIFIIVLVGYLVFRGLFNEVMDFASRLLIRHVTNGWLWMEAFLKPIDRICQIIIFLSAWFVLFLLYGWDRQSTVVERLNSLLHYQLVFMLNTSITPLSIIELAVIISLLFWAARWTREFVYRLLLSRTKDLGLRNSIAIFSQYMMVLIGIFICLRVLGIDFRALAAVAAAFAFGVGLGLRDLANNFVCGFLLLIERPLRVGDIISIGEYEGEVTHIGGRAVAIRTWDRFEVLIPNADIFSKSFTNWTARDNIIRTVINIKINRHDSPHDVQAIIRETLLDCKDVLSDPPPEAYLKELADGLVEFEVRYFINLRQVKSRVGVRSDVLIAIWEAFEKHGIQPPYPHHEVHVKNGPGFLLENKTSRGS